MAIISNQQYKHLLSICSLLIEEGYDIIFIAKLNRLALNPEYPPILEGVMSLSNLSKENRSLLLKELEKDIEDFYNEEDNMLKKIAKNNTKTKSRRNNTVPAENIAAIKTLLKYKVANSGGQAKIARKIGITNQSLNRFFKELDRPPSDRLLFQIATAVGMTIEETQQLIKNCSN